MKQYGGGKVLDAPGKPQGFEESGSVSRDIPGIGFAAYTSDWPNHTYEMEQDNLKPVGHNGFTVQAQAMAALLHDFATNAGYRAAVEKEFTGIRGCSRSTCSAGDGLSGAEGGRPEVAGGRRQQSRDSSRPAGRLAMRPRACALHWRHVHALPCLGRSGGRRVPGFAGRAGADAGRRTRAAGHAPHRGVPGVHAAERAARDPARGSHRSARHRQRLVSRRAPPARNPDAPASRTSSSTSCSWAPRTRKYGDFDGCSRPRGTNNASTAEDRTNYYIDVPSNALDLALFLESDRMAYLIEAMSPKTVDAQRDVVKNERRQSYENAPYGMASIEIAELVYPKGHPYRWPTIGYMEDLTAASYEDVVDFFRTYYQPANASLVVAGDIDPAKRAPPVEKWFADVKAGTAPIAADRLPAAEPDRRQDARRSRIASSYRGST